jgi:multidrug resistance efflux pump
MAWWCVVLTNKTPNLPAMRFHLLYVLIAAAAAACYWIVGDLRRQGDYTFFGAAETEGRIINTDFAALIQHIYVRPGAAVRRGDTLALLFRADLGRKTQEYATEIRQLETEEKTRADLLNQERDLLLTKHNARVAAAEAEIKLLETESSVQEHLKKIVTKDAAAPSPALPDVRLQKINALRTSMEQMRREYEEQLAQISAQVSANRTLWSAKKQQVQQNMGFLEAEKPRLALVAPIDGFVEQVSAAPLEMVQAYRELFKINPTQPDKVIGFIHESTQILFRIGDSVLLTSVNRPDVQCRAAIHGVSPKMVELPFRLRKFMEVRTWGREVYMNIPEQNGFFIGEKIVARF